MREVQFISYSLYSEQNYKISEHLIVKLFHSFYLLLPKSMRTPKPEVEESVFLNVC